jgi:two-component system, sensor histidine kinase
VMDGPTALGLIRKKYGTAIPVIALTASAFKSEVDQMLNMGFADCITKPIDQKTLSNRLVTFFSGASTKDKFFNAVYQKIISNINTMVSKDDKKAANLIGYLLEELNHAVSAWKECITTSDWLNAKMVLHREKAMINSIGVEGIASLISQIEDETKPRSSSEMVMLYSQLIDLFSYLKTRLGQT